MKAWHFTSDTLRDGQPLPAIGETLKHDGKLVMCASGLHASKRIIDALEYAPGCTIHRVDCRGEVLQQDDKLVCTERTILWRIDGEDVLRKFARLCALDVIHLWDAPDVVIKFLKTGDESLRAAAWDAARGAARAAAWAAAWAAARGAARGAARAAAGNAAWAAAWDASWSAERAAAWNAERAAAWNAERDASWSAERAAAWNAAWNAERAANNNRLTRMVNYAHNKGK